MAHAWHTEPISRDDLAQPCARELSAITRNDGVRGSSPRVGFPLVGGVARPGIVVGEIASLGTITFETRVNTGLRQRGTTAAMTFSFAEAFEHLSHRLERVVRVTEDGPEPRTRFRRGMA